MSMIIAGAKNFILYIRDEIWNAFKGSSEKLNNDTLVLSSLAKTLFLIFNSFIRLFDSIKLQGSWLDKIATFIPWK